MTTAKNTPASFKVRSKVWIENDRGEVVFGSGRYNILETIQRLGSLSAAAKELNMSYKGLQARITATEKRLGRPLLIKGSSGSTLTPDAEYLLKRFRRVNSMVASECDEVLNNFMKEALSPDVS